MTPEITQEQKTTKEKKKASNKKVKKPSKVELKKKMLKEKQEYFQDHLKIEEISENEVIRLLGEHHDRSIGVKEEQAEKLNAIADLAKLPLAMLHDKIVEMGINFYSKRYAAVERMGARERKKDKRSGGTAHYRIEDRVKKLMAANDKTKNRLEKVYICQTILEKKYGHGRDASKAYLALNEEMLTEHHKKHELGKRHNATSVILRNNMEYKQLQEEKVKAGKKKGVNTKKSGKNVT